MPERDVKPTTMRMSCADHTHADDAFD